MAAGAPALAADHVSYDDLYTRWEKGSWSARGLDLTQDLIDWQERFTEFERRATIWNCTVFLHGEDSVTDNLGPYIDAAPREEQKYFLATQQADEARHSVFFGRFMREIAGRGDSFSEHLAVTEHELSWGFRKTFELLDKVSNSLRRDKSKPNLARAICMYHIVIEAALAQPAQHYMEGYLRERGVMPGFLRGMENVANDEQRHIAFGVRCLADLQREDPDCKYAVAELLREATPLAIGLITPPNWDRRYLEVFGTTMEQLVEHGLESLEQKLRAAGLPLEELPGPPPLPLGRSARERAEQAVGLLEAGMLGEKARRPSRDADTVALFFDAIAGSADKRAVNGGMSIQWNFKDADPWYVRIDNGSTASGQGRLERPDVILNCRFDDWVDIAAGRQDPRMAMLTGKLRPKGRIGSLLRMQKVFPR
ncbi:MAG: ribonucleotide-diphosphate reductase subunit beta [Gaiellaceae bacterium]